MDIIAKLPLWNGTLDLFFQVFFLAKLGVTLREGICFNICDFMLKANSNCGRLLQINK